MFVFFKSLIFSLCRLERLQRVVGKVQMESGVCEEQLNQVETLLQAVAPKTFSLKIKKNKQKKTSDLTCQAEL